MTRLEEEMHDARSACTHCNMSGICVQCAVKAAQSVQNELLDRYKKRGEELLAFELERNVMQEKLDERNQGMNDNAQRVLVLQKKLDAIRLAGAAGLSKREQFAAMALQGMIAWGGHSRGFLFDELAQASVNAADALIEALEASK